MWHWYMVVPFVLCVFVYVRQTDRFFQTHLDGIRFGRFAFPISFFLLFLGEIFAVEQFNTPYFLYMIIVLSLCIGLVVVLFYGEMERKILAVLIFVTIWILVGNLTDSVLSIITLFLLKSVKGETGAFINGEIGTLISCVVLISVAAVISRLSGRLNPVFQNKIKRWYRILSVALFFIIVLAVVVGHGASRGIMVVSNANGARYWSVFYNQVLSHVAMSILSVLSLCVAGFLIFGMNRIYEEQRKKERYVSQIAFYKMLEEQYSQMERLRHDMKNHVIALRGLLGNQEWEAMENYLMRMMESGSLEKEEDVTWSRGVNALLYEKRRLAEEGGVRWSCDVNLPKEFHVEEFDLCVLFGNMLDNALEACGRMDEKKEKWIDIQSGTVKKCFLIEIRNSMEEEKPDKMKKENPKWHGTGLNNIADTVKRYDGVVNIEMQEGVFMISVLLPLKV